MECYSDLVAQITADSLTLSGAGVTSACGISYVVTRSALPAFDNCPATYTITWTVTDSCGTKHRLYYGLYDRQCGPNDR